MLFSFRYLYVTLNVYLWLLLSICGPQEHQQLHLRRPIGIQQKQTKINESYYASSEQSVISCNYSFGVNYVSVINKARSMQTAPLVFYNISVVSGGGQH